MASPPPPPPRTLLALVDVASLRPRCRPRRRCLRPRLFGSFGGSEPSVCSMRCAARRPARRRPLGFLCSTRRCVRANAALLPGPPLCKGQQHAPAAAAAQLAALLQHFQGQVEAEAGEGEAGGAKRSRCARHRPQAAPGSAPAAAAAVWALSAPPQPAAEAAAARDAYSMGGYVLLSGELCLPHFGTIVITHLRVADARPFPALRPDDSWPATLSVAATAGCGRGGNVSRWASRCRRWLFSSAEFVQVDASSTRRVSRPRPCPFWPRWVRPSGGAAAGAWARPPPPPLALRAAARRYNARWRRNGRRGGGRRAERRTGAGLAFRRRRRRPPPKPCGRSPLARRVSPAPLAAGRDGSTLEAHLAAPEAGGAAAPRTVARPAARRHYSSVTGGAASEPAGLAAVLPAGLLRRRQRRGVVA